MHLPNFAQLPEGRFNSWPYMGGFTGLSDEQKMEIKEWVEANIFGPSEISEIPWMVHFPTLDHHENKALSRFVVSFKDETDFILFKLRFSGFESVLRR